MRLVFCLLSLYRFVPIICNIVAAGLHWNLATRTDNCITLPMLVAQHFGVVAPVVSRLQTSQPGDARCVGVKVQRTPLPSGI